ncbi:MAG TPA: methylated-DNA--[protein]-cysteine S-methyltransferase [Candidatus Limnocylindrales bacterium]
MTARSADPAGVGIAQRLVGIAVAPTPWGPVHLAASGIALVGLEVRTTEVAFRAGLARRGFVTDPPGAMTRTPVGAADAADAAVRAVLDAMLERIAAYVEGDLEALDRAPSPSLDLGGLSGWDRAVLDGVRRVRVGTATSYGRLARAIGRVGAARAVGGAVGRNPIGLVVPCHRIIAGDGSIGGYGGAWSGSRLENLELKRALLEHEGVLLPYAFPRPAGVAWETSVGFGERQVPARASSTVSA